MVHSFIEYASLESSQIPKHSTLSVAYSAHMGTYYLTLFWNVCQFILVYDYLGVTVLTTMLYRLTRAVKPQRKLN